MHQDEGPFAMMWLNRKLLLVVALLAGSIFAHSPSTAHFCVSSFDLHYEGFFSLEIRAVQKAVPDTEWNWPDSLMCGRTVWTNNLVLNYKGAQIQLDGNYDAEPSKFSCNLCSDMERLRKRVVANPSIGRAKVFQDIDADEKFKQVDSAFIRELYGKKIKAEWESGLFCVCPYYSPALFKTELDVIIDGPCSPTMDSTTWELKQDESDWRCTAKDKSSGLSQEVALPDGMMPCFFSYREKKWAEPLYYVSTKRMNMVGKPEGLDENLECFDVNGERLVVFGSNVPDQTYNEVKGPLGGDCYANFSDFKKKKLWEKSFYSCNRDESTSGGCKAVEHGLDFVMDANGNFIGWDRKALWLYLELKEANDIRKFYEALGNNILVKETLLPANFPESKVQEVGDDAARKTAGMAFYRGKKRVRYKRFKQNQLKSMQDAIDMCKAWK